MLGVSNDAPADNRAFRDKFSFPYDLLSDEDMAVAAAYGATAPDRPRALRISVLVGPDRRVAAAYAEVTPADHPAQVLADLDKLG